MGRVITLQYFDSLLAKTTKRFLEITLDIANSEAKDWKKNNKNYDNNKTQQTTPGSPFENHEDVMQHLYILSLTNIWAGK